MFDVTADDIARLTDDNLRELVGRLCEAELASRGLSPAFVTWGGNQTAADGGLDVRVALPQDTTTDGFIQRPSTGFQVKTPDMPRAAILNEMRPEGGVRPVIQELADAFGSYVIVSSHGSTADSALHNRRKAMRDAIAGIANAGQLHTDFFDRTRMATWVRLHPGLVTWVKERVGRALVGWRSYGAWSGAAERVDAEYVLDDKLRIHFGTDRDATTRRVIDAVDELRDELSKPGTMLRLVGLSGVGKTRLAQALFDPRIGSRPLPPSIAVYTNLSDNPSPQPTGLASDLIAMRTRAILIVDNCPPELHRRLSDLCAASGSTVSVLTIEYDVRDDQPEGTQVVTLDTSSPELIEKLIGRRYPHLSQVDARTIAEASGGNARIAIALAETVGHSESIAGLSDEELFQRLFRQRHDPDSALLFAAQACSLVYSFQGEMLTGEEAELPRLALLAGQPPQELYRCVGELLRRDLIQQRGVWRAVLPHAIANRLAARALEDTPFDLIDQQLITGGTDRLAQSFSRRLSFLHDHPRAVAIVQRWLEPGGFLGDATAFNDLGSTMFENVASVSPEAALATLERADGDPAAVAAVWHRHRSLLRSLAYDSLLFERSALLLVRAAVQITDERESEEVSDTFCSLFTIYLSGTHATIEQRLRLLERLLRSGEPKQRSLGLAALDEVLQTTHVSSSHRFEFGSRSRDYGYRPRSNEDVAKWYGAALALIERLIIAETAIKPELRDLVARNFRGLWSSAHMHDELEQLFRGFAADGFWRDGWAACRLALQFDKGQLTQEGSVRLTALEADMRPSNLVEQVRAVVLGDKTGRLDLEDFDIAGEYTNDHERREAVARELGASTAVNSGALAVLLPDLLRGGNKVFAFGRGLAAGSPDWREMWATLMKGTEQLPSDQLNVQVFRGFLAELWDQDRILAETFLDTAADQPILAASLPLLQTAVQIDTRGVERLKRALGSGKTPIWMYQYLAYGRIADDIEGSDLKCLLLLIADEPAGLDVAMEVLYMRLYSDGVAARPHQPELQDAGRELLRRVKFTKGSQNGSHNLAGIVRACLTDEEAGPLAAEIGRRFRQAVADRETYAFDHDELVGALLSAQPAAVLDALLDGDEKDQRVGIHIFERFHGHRRNPADEISCEALIAWCDRDRERRYALAASIVTFVRRSEDSGSQVWSEHAKALLANAPASQSVLAVFVKRFRPMSWTGSRAALIEANARLLDQVEGEVSGELISFVAEAKERLAREIETERRWEAEHDRARDERFE